MRANVPVLAAAALILAAVLTGCSGSHPDSTPLPSATPSVSQAPASAPLEAGVTPIDCDPVGRAREDAVSVLAEGAYRIGGWNHINGVGSFSTVSQTPGAYKITAENYLEQPDCAEGARALSVVLVKKTYDWDRQHANGMESAFGGDGLTFGEVGDIVLELRLDPEPTVIPSATDLEGAYGDLLSADELARLDAQEVNLELTLFGTGATADQPFMNAGTIVALNPALASDGWLRVVVPREELTFYTEENYARTEVGADAHQDLLVQGLRINPETSEGLTVRHFLAERGDEFDVTAKPELFKEMGVTFSLIQVGRG